MSEEEMITMTIRFPASLHAAIKAIAKREERVMAQLVRYACQQYVDARKQ